MKNLRSPVLATLPVLLLGWFLRLVRLDNRPLWYDEGVSLTFANLPWQDVLHYQLLWQDVNPPAYRLLLGVWLQPVGVSDFTARFLSVLAGMLAVALIYRAVRWLNQRRETAVLAAAFVAIAPMQIYYSREAKGYTFVQAFLLITILIWLRVFPIWQGKARLPQRPLHVIGLWLLIFGATALAFGAHYMALLMIVTTCLWTLAWVTTALDNGAKLWPSFRMLLFWGTAQAAGVVAWLPWFLATRSGVAAGAESASSAEGLVSQPLFVYLLRMFSQFVTGPGSQSDAGIVTYAALTLFMIGLWTLRADLRRLRLVAAWLLGPLMLGWLVQLAIPFFFPRFLLYASTGLIVAAAIAVEDGMSTQRVDLPQSVLRINFFAFILIAFVLMLMGALARQYFLFDAEPDLRPVAEELEASYAPGDALIYSYSWQPGTLNAYLPPASQPEYYASFFPPGQLEAEMSRILAEHERVWLLTYQIDAADPINDVGGWLLANAASAGGTWHHSSQLTLFFSPTLFEQDNIQCSAFDRVRVELCYSELVIIGQPVDFILLPMQWQAAEDVPAGLSVFVHIVKPGSPVPVAQLDGYPGSDAYPPEVWQAERPLQDLRVLDVRAFPPGEYEVLVGLYDPAAAQRLTLRQGGDAVPLGRFSLP